MVGALLGTVTPFCSCSSIPLFIGFTRAGLPLGVTFSFLISSPMVDLGSLVLIMSIFGPGVAIAYTAVGLVIAIAGGTIIQRMGMEKHLADFVRGDAPADAELLSMTVAERLATPERRPGARSRRCSPTSCWRRHRRVHPQLDPRRVDRAGPGRRQPLRSGACHASGRTNLRRHLRRHPHRGGLYYKGTGLGTVLAFMMSVTTLSIPSLTMLSRVIKPRLMVTFVGLCIVGMCISGYAFNFLQPLF